LIAVVCGPEQITYSELNERSNRLARYLKACGVRRGGAAAISTVRSIEMVVGLLAILKAGAAYVPLNFDYPSNWLRQRLEDVRPGAILTQHCFIDGLPPMDSQIVCLDEEECCAPFGSENLSIMVAADDLAYVMFTSGSTGEPKGVEVPHRGVVRLLCGIDYATLDENVVVLQHSPLSFDASTFEIWAPLLYGGRLVLLPPAATTPATLEEALKANKVTTLWLTSSLFNLIIE
jgi:surfactin family lipopeptide synthetase C